MEALQPYADGLRALSAPELAVVALFLVVSALLVVLVVRAVAALLRDPPARGPRPAEGEEG